MIKLNGKGLTINKASKIILSKETVRLSEACLKQVEAAYQSVKQAIEDGKQIYGVSTGFGKLSDVLIPYEQQKQLQENLLKSHTVGVGEPLPDEASRATLLFRLNSLLKGYSGIRKQVVHCLAELLNHNVCPLIPAKGSVGASGDLAPLAHMALILIGEGEAKLDGEVLSGRAVLQRLGLEPLELEPKEGLALINGTQVSLGVGFVAFIRARKLLEWAEVLSALTLEAYGGKLDPFNEWLQRVRPHPGQIAVATRIRELLQESKLINRNEDTQDPYSLRCVPAILGASLDALEFVTETIEIEMNSATDNPLVFPETGEIISGGNFHGQPLALAFELLAQATAEIGSLAERQIAQLLSAPGLPEVLVEEPGLNSGLMLSQYTAAALVSENKVLAHPGAVDSIPTSGLKEDHNSLCSISANKALQIVENVEHILSFELLTVAQALDFRDTRKMAPATKKVYERFRNEVPHLGEDRILTGEIQRARELITAGVIS
ncbi:MAG: histidine ammonia-lyase [Candidatus Bipolaricaulia bacterium]